MRLHNRIILEGLIPLFSELIAPTRGSFQNQLDMFLSLPEIAQVTGQPTLEMCTRALRNMVPAMHAMFPQVESSLRRLKNFMRSTCGIALSIHSMDETWLISAISIAVHESWLSSLESLLFPGAESRVISLESSREVIILESESSWVVAKVSWVLSQVIIAQLVVST